MEMAGTELKEIICLMVPMVVVALNINVKIILVVRVFKMVDMKSENFVGMVQCVVDVVVIFIMTLFRNLAGTVVTAKKWEVRVCLPILQKTK